MPLPRKVASKTQEGFAAISCPRLPNWRRNCTSRDKHLLFYGGRVADSIWGIARRDPREYVMFRSPGFRQSHRHRAGLCRKDGKHLLDHRNRRPRDREACRSPPLRCGCMSDGNTHQPALSRAGIQPLVPVYALCQVRYGRVRQGFDQNTEDFRKDVAAFRLKQGWTAFIRRLHPSRYINSFQSSSAYTPPAVLTSTRMERCLPGCFA